jgi:hypothetical protein
MDDLHSAAEKFKEWRGSKRHYRYPEYFWDQIKQFSKKYPLDLIADSFGISLHYLRIKFPNPPPFLTFQSLKIVSPPSAVSIEFMANSQPMTVRLNATPEELVKIILSLSEEK